MAFGEVDQEQRVAVGGRAHDRLGADIAAGARPVLDDELLAEPLRQPLADQARDDVVRAAGGKADDDAHRPRRIGLRPCDARDGRQRGGARCQMQKFTTGKFHDDLRRSLQQAASLRFDASRLDDRPPFLDFGLLLCGERFGRLLVARPGSWPISANRCRTSDRPRHRRPRN